MPNLVILTGAGISAESGIPTFRASDGLWENHRVDDVASPKGFKKNPALVHQFYNERRAKLKEVQPNAAHYALAKLEHRWPNSKGNGFLLVTQNVDDLHERAGSVQVAHMHGELRRIKCVSCSHEQGEFDGETSVDTQCPQCTLPMRPDVVWFGEMPYHLAMIEPVLDVTDIFISIGTSGQVQPASLFASAVRMANPKADIIEVNPNPTRNVFGLRDTPFNRVIAEPASVGVPDLVNELLDRYGKRFVQLAAEGVLPLELVDEYVGRWHDSLHTTGIPLHEFLGMTEEQYAGWVKDPDTLEAVVQAFR